MGVGEAVGGVMAAATESLPRLIQQRRLIGAVWPVAGQTTVGGRRMDNSTFEVASRVAACTELALGLGE
jgi:hypothetical protein